MQIREAREEELDQLVAIWLEGSKQAHYFVDSSYWEENKEMMRGLYLPLSENKVVLEKGEIKGFLSLMGEYLAAIFIFPKEQGKGYGKALLDQAKSEKDRLELKVYEKNTKALCFYKQNGFEIRGKAVDELTGEKEYLLEWTKIRKHSVEIKQEV